VPETEGHLFLYIYQIQLEFACNNDVVVGGPSREAKS
jgi:hypothetical protein